MPFHLIYFIIVEKKKTGEIFAAKVVISLTICLSLLTFINNKVILAIYISMLIFILNIIFILSLFFLL